MGAIPPFLLKTAGNPGGVDQSVFGADRRGAGLLGGQDGGPGGAGSPAAASRPHRPGGRAAGVWGLFLAKYRLQLRALMYAERVSAWLWREPRERVYLELTVSE